MADQNSYLTIGMVTKESLDTLLNNTQFIKCINTEYRREFAQSGAKIGAKLQVRKPIPWVVEDGDGFNDRPFLEEWVDLEITKHQHCDMSFGMVEQTLNIINYSRNYVRPRVSELGNAMDDGAMALTYWQVANSLGPGTTLDPNVPNTWDTYAYAKALLDQYATPKSERYVLVSSWEQSGIVIDNKALFNQQSAIADQYESGDMWKTLGARWHMDQNMPIHTTGPRGGTPVVDGNNQTGGQLRVRGFTAAVGLRLRRGDTFQIAVPTTGPGLYGTNPRNKRTVGRYQDFTCLEDVYSDAAGGAVIPLSPPIILGPDPRQTVDTVPLDGWALAFRGAANTQYAQNLFFHRDAFTLATVDFEPPQGDVKWSRAVDPEAGVTVQGAVQFDIRSYKNLSRLDDLWGCTSLRPECAVRVWSKANVVIP
jgi:hypothetical protein